MRVPSSVQTKGDRKRRPQLALQYEGKGKEEIQHRGHFHRYTAFVHVPATPTAQTSQGQTGEIPPRLESSRNPRKENSHRRRARPEDQWNARLSGRRIATRPRL